MAYKSLDRFWCKSCDVKIPSFRGRCHLVTRRMIVLRLSSQALQAVILIANIYMGGYAEDYRVAVYLTA
jgi:hypothetical protein